MKANREIGHRFISGKTGRAIQEVHWLTGLERQRLRMAFALFFECVRDEVLHSGDFEVPGVGVFRLASLKAKRVRNPQTNEWMIAPARRAIRFRPAKDWRGL